MVLEEVHDYDVPTEVAMEAIGKVAVLVAVQEDEEEEDDDERRAWRSL